MIKKLICIECPQGCAMVAEIENGRVLKLSGNKCPKGEGYTKREIENPTRTLTSSVLTDGLEILMLPVRTSAPIPKTILPRAMEEMKKIRVKQPVKAGDIIVKDFLVPGVNLTATRSVK